MDTSSTLDFGGLDSFAIGRNEEGLIIDKVCGYPIKQHFNKKAGRWYVWIPKNSGLRELCGGRDRLLRSHYVWMSENDIWKIPAGHVIHHMDHNRLNDDPVNLLLMSVAKHEELHSSEEGRIHARRKYKPFKKHSDESIEKMKAIASQRGNNDVWGGPKKTHFDSTLEKMRERSSGDKNAMYRSDIDIESVTQAYKDLGSLSAVARLFDCSIQAIRSRLESRSINPLWSLLSDDEIIKVVDSFNGRVTTAARHVGAPLTSFSRRVKRIKEKHEIRKS